MAVLAGLSLTRPVRQQRASPLLRAREIPWRVTGLCRPPAVLAANDAAGIAQVAVMTALDFVNRFDQAKPS